VTETRTTSWTSTPTFTSSTTYTGTPTLTPTITDTPTITLTPTVTDSPTATPVQKLSDGQGVVLAPMPVHRGGDLCLYPESPIIGSRWEVYNVLGISVADRTYTSPIGNCWDTGGFAPGMYFVRLTLSYTDGKETKTWKKVVVTP
jgi:hypothetical protein